jgi:alpha-L-rhamnosidase
MATGFLGTRHLLPALTATGHQDLAVRMLQSRDFPSWGYEVANGATSIWERWNSFTKDKGFGDAAMNSFSHYSFGAVTEWMFESLAGIETDGPGFQHISIQPGPPKPGSNPHYKPIDHVRAEYESIQGRIVSEWWVKDGRLELEVAIPPNCRATIHVPADPGTVTVEGTDPPKELRKHSYVRGDVTFQVGSGRYRFTSKWATE